MCMSMNRRHWVTTSMCAHERKKPYMWTFAFLGFVLCATFLSAEAILPCPCWTDKSMENRVEKNMAYNQERWHLLRLPSEGINYGHHIIEHLVFTWGEMEHAEEQNSTPSIVVSATQGYTALIQQNCKSKDSLSALLQMMDIAIFRSITTKGEWKLPSETAEWIG